MPFQIEQSPNNKFKVRFNKWSEVEIGDIEKTKFKPHIKLKKWGEECFIKIEMPHKETDEFEAEFEANKIKIKKKTGEDEYELELYPLESREFEENGRIVKQLEQGGFEFQIIENKKTQSQLVLDLELGNVVAFYQPSLTEEFQSGWSDEFQTEIVVTETTVKDLDGNTLVHRPENVVGSIVFYHATKGNIHPVGEAEKYKTSKIGMLYRVKIVDAIGNWAWGEQEIKDGKLRITRPQSFLDNAIYPIKHAGGLTFGNTTLQNTELSRTNSSHCRAQMWANARHTAITGDTITKMTVGARVSTGSGSIGTAAYTFDDNVPITRLGAETMITITNTIKGWVDSSAISREMSNGVVYVVALGNWTPIDNILYTYYDSGSAGDNSQEDGGALPATWSEIATSAFKFSVYATYELPVTKGPLPMFFRQ